MRRVLSFEEIPPLSVPLRFFLTAPIFAALAAFLLLGYGESALSSRWSPITLALTHLLTLGFLGMSMIGALAQILPVVAGVHLPRPALTASVIHWLLVAGSLALASGFLTAAPLLFAAALVLLGAGFMVFLGACLYGLRQANDANATLVAICLALLALSITVGLGLGLASVFAWPTLAWPLVSLTNLHAGWGLAGWVGLLVAGVAYQVIPMFQVTPLFPQPFAKWFAPVAFLLLTLYSLVTLVSLSSLGRVAYPVLAILTGATYAVLAITTLHLLKQRKRPKPDTTTFFWATSLGSLLAASLLWMTAAWLPSLAHQPAYPLLLGVLMIVGFGYSAINGMLYKIVPFLVWHHLQTRLAGGPVRAPNVRQIIPESATQRQWMAHAAALGLMVGACLWPAVLARLSGFALLLSAGGLAFNLLTALRVYCQHLPKD